MRYITRSARQTFLFAKELGKEIFLRSQKTPLVIGLIGELGAGKTTFVKGFAKGLGIKKRITSPTFILIASYPLEGGGNLYHIDPYRLTTPLRQLMQLGFNDIINEAHSIIVIEWANTIKRFLPKDTIWITLTHQGGDEREIMIKSKIKSKKSK